MAPVWRNLLLGGAALAMAAAASALAQESPIEGVVLEDPEAALAEAEAEITAALGPQARPGFGVSFNEERAPRFNFTPTQGDGGRQVSLAVSAGGAATGAPFDVSVSRRASLGANAEGDIDQQGAGAEVRIGRGLVQQDAASGERGAVYLFVASDDEALTWRPGQRSDLGGQRGGFALQDRVEVGDVSAGVTYERGGVQASIAYVEREVSAQVGRESYTNDERFAGVTVTMRR